MSFRKAGMLAVALAVCVLANDLMAQPGGRGGRGGFGGFSMFNSPEMRQFNLLRNKSVLDAIDATEDQTDEINEVMQDFQSQMGEMFRNREFDGLADLAKDTMEDAKSILLAKQKKMLENIYAQQTLFGALNSPARILSSMTEMDEEEAEEFEESDKFKDLKSDYAKEMAELRMKYAKKMADALPSSIGKELKAQLGDKPIVIEQPSRRSGFGGFGGRGGGPGGRGEGGPQRGGERSRPKGDDF